MPCPDPDPDAVLAHWRSPTGVDAVLRSIAPCDLDAETAFVAGLSPDTSYNRLFSARRPGPEELRRWTHIDPAREAAIVAMAGPSMLGVARYVRGASATDAEFAIVVGDAWKRGGLGHALLVALIAQARRDGLAVLWGTTLAGNAAMLGLGQRLGMRAGREPGDATLVRMSLALGN